MFYYAGKKYRIVNRKVKQDEWFIYNHNGEIEVYDCLNVEDGVVDGGLLRMDGSLTDIDIMFTDDSYYVLEEIKGNN